ncbi:MAG: hypothetical protein HQM09_04545 [Candidatus Riflebacteria bacterium]|nr:hypothetical protein [Candidatus Riflebacteria bacterium]
MNMQRETDASDQTTRKCPFCAELIMKAAIKCRFCQTMLVDESGNPVSMPIAGTKISLNPPPASPSIWTLLIWNVLCPGAAALKLGHRMRGWLIIGAVVACMLLWTKEVMVVVNQAVSAAQTGKAINVHDTAQSLQSGIWYDLMVYIYLYSFIDILFIYPWKSGKSDSL